MILPTPSGRLRALGYFLIAACYFQIARLIAVHAAAGLVSGEWFDLTERTILLFLLLVGYAGMGRAFERQQHPLQTMGLIRRRGWQRELGLGAALGWGMLLASILPMVLTGGLLVAFWSTPRSFEILVADVALLAIASLGEEIAFRGYPFQRLIEAIGPVLATLLISLLFALIHVFNPASTKTSLLVTVLSSWLLSIAYLRTRALWVCWGWHFAWNASMTLLFGLPLSGITRFSSVVQSDTIGAAWITGGDYGPEGSWVAVIVLLAGIVVLFRITRSYAYMYAQPEIRAAGIPVNLDAMSGVLAPHHPATTAPQLVQIEPSPPIESPRDPGVAQPLPPEESGSRVTAEPEDNHPG